MLDEQADVVRARRVLHITMLIAVLLIGCAGRVFAQRIEGREVASAVNLMGRDVKADGLLFVPSGLRRISAVVAILNYGSMSEQLYYDEGLRRVLRDTRCAAMFVRITNISPPLPDQPIASQVLRNAAVGGGSALEALLREFANVTGYRELRSTPIMFWGFSAAASFGATFAAIHPERTIGVVRYHTHRRGLSADVQAVSRIPALLIAGANDETAGVEDAEVLWTLGRAVDAPWTFAVEPDGAHASPEIHERTLRDLTIPWIAAVLRMRLAGDSTLRPVPNDQSWFADTRTFDIGPVLRFAPDQRTANWLPDEVSAHGWRAVARPIVRSVPTDPISGAWTGHAILGTNRVPLSIDLKLDDKAVSVALNMGGVVGETSSGTFDRQRGRLTFEVDARPSNNPRGIETHFVVEGVAFENTATGHFRATNTTGDFIGNFLITRP